MGWESKLAAFREVPGSRDPVLFRYPVGSLSAWETTIGTALLGTAWWIWRSRVPVLGGILEVPFILPMIAVGAPLLSLGLYDLFVRRHLEIHEGTGELVTVHRSLLGGEGRAVYPFGEILRVVIQEDRRDPEADPRAILRVEMKDRHHVDLGSLYSPEEGHRLADRVAALLRISKLTTELDPLELGP